MKLCEIAMTCVVCLVSHFPLTWGCRGSLCKWDWLGFFVCGFFPPDFVFFTNATKS